MKSFVMAGLLLLVSSAVLAATASWEAVVDPDLQGYKLYRAPGACANPGAFATVNTYGLVTTGAVTNNASSEYKAVTAAEWHVLRLFFL